MHSGYSLRTHVASLDECHTCRSLLIMLYHVVSPVAMLREAYRALNLYICVWEFCLFQQRQNWYITLVVNRNIVQYCRHNSGTKMFWIFQLVAGNQHVKGQVHSSVYGCLIITYIYINYIQLSGYQPPVCLNKLIYLLTYLTSLVGNVMEYQHKHIVGYYHSHNSVHRKWERRENYRLSQKIWYGNAFNFQNAYTMLSVSVIRRHLIRHTLKKDFVKLTICTVSSFYTCWYWYILLWSLRCWSIPLYLPVYSACSRNSSCCFI